MRLRRPSVLCLFLLGWSVAAAGLTAPDATRDTGATHRNADLRNQNPQAFCAPNATDDDSDDLTDEFALPALLDVPVTAPDPKFEALVFMDANFRVFLPTSNPKTRGPPSGF